MSSEIIAIDTDVLVIGSGAAGMYAAIEAARCGAQQGLQVLLADRSLIGRGGATVMAQMTVAAALGEETPDDWHHHYNDTIAAGRGLCDEKLAQLLCEDAPECIRELENWGVGWARKDGHITATTAPGHDRPRCVYVDFINTGPAVSKTLRTVMARNPNIRKAGDLCIVDLIAGDGEIAGAVGYHLGTGAAVTIAAKATVLATGGLTRLYRRNSASANMGGDGYALALRAGAALIDMEFVQFFPIGHLAPRLVGMDPDHVGSVPLQARRPAAQRLHGRVHVAIRLRRGRQIRAGARSRDLCHRQGGRGRARLAAWRRLFELRALQRRRRCAKRSAR